MFEKNIEKDSSIEDKLGDNSLKENFSNKYKELLNLNETDKSNNKEKQNIDENGLKMELDEKEDNNLKTDDVYQNLPEKVYKSNKDKFNFLQTQLSDDTIDSDNTINSLKETDARHIKDTDTENTSLIYENNEKSLSIENDNNVTDDSRIAQDNSISTNLDISSLDISEPNKIESEITISVPPRRKKQNNIEKKLKNELKTSISVKQYPDHLNPFSEDEDEVCVIY